MTQSVQNNGVSDSGKPAPINTRVYAYLLDTLILVIPTQALAFTIGDARNYYRSVIGGNASGPVPQAFEVATMAGLALSALYFLFTWTESGATVGMRLLGLEVLSLTDRAKMKMVQALSRSTVFWAPGLLDLLTGAFGSLLRLAVLLSIMGSPDRRGWHDKLSGTVVVVSARPAAITRAAALTVLLGGYLLIGSVVTALVVLG